MTKLLHQTLSECEKIDFLSLIDTSKVESDGKEVIKDTSNLYTG